MGAEWSNAGSPNGLAIFTVLLYNTLLHTTRSTRASGHDFRRKFPLDPIAETNPSADTMTAEERYRLLVEGAKDYAMILLDPEGRITSWNSGAERILGWAEAEVLGQPAGLIFTPEDRAAGVPARELGRASAEGKALDLRWHMKKDGSRFFADGIMEGLRDGHGRPRGFAKLLRDATVGKVADEERQRAQEALRAAHEQTAGVLESITDGFHAVDRDWNFTYLNPQAERIISRKREEVLGKNLWDEFPEAFDSPFGQQYRRAMSEGVPVSFAEFYPPLDAWLEVRAYPSPEGLSVFFRDITEQKERGRRERFLADLAERARGLTDPEEVIADAVRSVGEFLGVSRCVFADIEADACTVHSDYRADETVASVEGVVPISAFGAFVVAEYAARRAVAVDDVRLDPIRVPPESVAAYEAFGIRAHVTVPVVHTGRVVSCMTAHSAVPRHWTPEEVELLQTVVERTWLTVEVLRQQRALAREAEERRDAHARTTGILESISDGFIALDRDWRFTFLNDQAERVLFQRRDEVLGRVFWDVFPEALGTVFERQYRRAVAERVVVAFEEYFPPLDGWFEIRVYPSDGGLSLFFQNVNERKALEAERERLAERERNIAQQLQAALTPSVPERLPGMALAKHYKAALDEAGVGGDFYDVFPVDKGCTALVVGDLSGKGLAAASQVATVRNMLRYALYRARTLAGAVHGLNALLAEQGLLTGFATLFVGAYDSGAGTLTYVNCGQEPALIRRAVGGLVEQLVPTGPVLGSFEGAAFEERTVALGPGDALAVFTDGLTEVGRSRTEMLGVEGVADLLVGVVVPEETDGAEAVAEHLTLRLIAGVDAAAEGGVTRDDVCLLVGVVDD